jgi:hypothetical protein
VTKALAKRSISLLQDTVVKYFPSSLACPLELFTLQGVASVVLVKVLKANNIKGVVSVLSLFSIGRLCQNDSFLHPQGTEP